MLEERVGRVEQAAGSGVVLLSRCSCRHFPRFQPLDIELGLCPVTSSHQFAASCVSPLSWQPEVSPRHGPGLVYWLDFQEFLIQIQTRPPFCCLSVPQLASSVAGSAILCAHGHCHE